MGAENPTNQYRQLSNTTDGDAGVEGVKTGTTLVGVVAEDRVVLASDRRASLGGMVSSKDVRKVVSVADRAAMAFSGSMAGAQALTARLESQVRLYELRRGERMSTGALATALSNLLRRESFQTAPLLAGVDADGPHLYDVDVGGSLLEGEYAAGGSGTPYVYGLLEAEYEPGLSAEAAREVAATAVAVASERDLASGNGLVVGEVSRDGVDVRTVDDPTGFGRGTDVAS
ncbi:proteasome subunit beta [Halobium salinum]|uniref:Proteasome subunit beta n=1 Tax=Halobium salinum TaxID=1364940 RepID=A0ABD5PDS6_9EURY|nr:proteasome subunit beta [Halobium salinum]